MKKTVLLSLLLLGLAACEEVVKTPVAVAGSRADASVIMAYDVAMFEQVKPDWSKADKSAAERCQVWGYKNATAFEGTREECQAFNGYGNCIRATISKTYQCTGRG
nr:YecR family lipoprotein [uncultured Roseovarius sp.]